MRWPMLALFFVVSAWIRPAEACQVHSPSLAVRPRKAVAVDVVEHARIVIVGADVGYRFIKALEDLGHAVEVVPDARAVRDDARYDVAISTPAVAPELLEHLSVAMVVPVSDDEGVAHDFSFVLPVDPTQLEERVQLIRLALARRPKPIARTYLAGR